MDIHQTEEQQVEALKSFWKENGNAIIVGLVLGFGGFIGYGFYTENKLQNELQISESYQEVIALAGEDNKEFRDAAAKFITENTTSNYSGLAALSLAKDAATHKDWVEVEKQLNIAINNTSEVGIKAIATLRLARVQIQTEQYEAALTTLAQPIPESFKASVEETKGDVYLKQENADLARNAYQAAVDASGDNVNPTLKMKLDDLAQNIVLAK